MKNNIIINLFLGISVLLMGGCKEFLDAKPDQHLVVPQKLQDLQALLDDNFINVVPGIAEGSADNFYLIDADYNSLPFDRERNIYLWRNTAIDGDAGNWRRLYNIVLSCNVVLEILETNDYPDQEEFARQIKGRALFHRSGSFFNALQLFAKAYDENTATKELGIPLRLSSDFDQVNRRNTIAECYQQIIADLKIAAGLLEIKGVIATRPDRCNTFALLARVNLFKNDYPMAKTYADSALNLNSELIDYNTLDKDASTPFKAFNTETTFYATGGAALLSSSRAKINPDLYQQYEANDLRKLLFFRKNTDGTYRFKGSYSGQNGTTLFTGMTTAEILLTRAEAQARGKQIGLAMEDLNNLLRKRYQTGTFSARTAPNDAEALRMILAERRKELIFRGLRWYDLKRLNKNPATASTLTRVTEGNTYILNPNSNNYVFPIPQEVIELGKLMQND